MSLNTSERFETHEVQARYAVGDFDKNERLQLKEALKRYMFLAQSIGDQVERLEELRKESIGSPELSDMPKGPMAPRDRIGDKVAKMEMIEADITDMQKEYMKLGKTITMIESKMKRAVEKKVINLRYEDGKDWTEIARRVYAGKGVKVNNYNEDSCRRYVQAVHGDALDSILRICALTPELKFW